MKVKRKSPKSRRIVQKSYLNDFSIYRRGSQRSPATLVATNQSCFEMDDIGAYITTLAEGEYKGFEPTKVLVDIQGYSSGPYACRHFLAIAGPAATISTSYHLDALTENIINGSVGGDQWDFIPLGGLNPAKCVGSNLWVTKSTHDITRFVKKWIAKEALEDGLFLKLVTITSSNQLQTMDFFPRTHIYYKSTPKVGSFLVEA